MSGVLCSPHRLLAELRAFTLRRLTREQLEGLLTWEKAHRNRKKLQTVLEKRVARSPGPAKSPGSSVPHFSLGGKGDIGAGPIHTGGQQQETQKPKGSAQLTFEAMGSWEAASSGAARGAAAAKLQRQQRQQEAAGTGGGSSSGFKPITGASWGGTPPTGPTQSPSDAPPSFG